MLKTERDKAAADERKASRALTDLKKQFESQELVSRKKVTNYIFSLYMYMLHACAQLFSYCFIEYCVNEEECLEP